MQDGHEIEHRAEKYKDEADEEGVLRPLAEGPDDARISLFGDFVVGELVIHHFFEVKKDLFGCILANLGPSRLLVADDLPDCPIDGGIVAAQIEQVKGKAEGNKMCQNPEQLSGTPILREGSAPMAYGLTSVEPVFVQVQVGVHEEADAGEDFEQGRLDRHGAEDGLSIEADSKEAGDNERQDGLPVNDSLIFVVEGDRGLVEYGKLLDDPFAERLLIAIGIRKPVVGAEHVVFHGVHFGCRSFVLFQENGLQAHADSQEWNLLTIVMRGGIQYRHGRGLQITVQFVLRKGHEEGLFRPENFAGALRNPDAGELPSACHAQQIKNGAIHRVRRFIPRGDHHVDVRTEIFADEIGVIRVQTEHLIAAGDIECR